MEYFDMFFGFLWPVAAFAGINIDQAWLAPVQVGISTETLEVGGGISRVWVQTIRFSRAKVGNRVWGSGWGTSGGRLGRKTYKSFTLSNLTLLKLNFAKKFVFSVSIYLPRELRRWLTRGYTPCEQNCPPKSSRSSVHTDAPPRFMDVSI